MVEGARAPLKSGRGLTSRAESSRGQRADSPTGEQDGGVILVAHDAGDLRQAQIGVLAGQIHGHVSGQGDGAALSAGMKIGRSHSEICGDD